MHLPVQPYASNFPANGSGAPRDMGTSQKTPAANKPSPLPPLPPHSQASVSAEWAALKSKAANWQQLSGAEVKTGAIYAAEVVAFFCVGEAIGRGTWVGYNIEGDGFPVEHH